MIAAVGRVWGWGYVTPARVALMRDETGSRAEAVVCVRGVEEMAARESIASESTGGPARQSAAMNVADEAGSKKAAVGMPYAVGHAGDVCCELGGEIRQ